MLIIVELPLDEWVQVVELRTAVTIILPLGPNKPYVILGAYKFVCQATKREVTEYFEK